MIMHNTQNCVLGRAFELGGVHKLCWQEEVGRLGSPKMSTFVNVYKVDNVNVGG